MLVLSRKRGEKILVGKDITISIEGLGNGKVRIGIIAPKETIIHRQEVAEKIKAQLAESLGREGKSQ